jgi:hypothetical protein
MSERITKINVITSVTTAKTKDIISRTCVSIQEICKIGDVSHIKWSITKWNKVGTNRSKSIPSHLYVESKKVYLIKTEGKKEVTRR